MLYWIDFQREAIRKMFKLQKKNRIKDPNVNCVKGKKCPRSETRNTAFAKIDTKIIEE